MIFRDSSFTLTGLMYTTNYLDRKSCQVKENISVFLDIEMGSGVLETSADSGLQYVSSRFVGHDGKNEQPAD